MSFASDVKNELCRVPLGRHCCAVAEAYGVLLYCHTFTTRELRIVTACDAFAERLPKLFRRAFGAHFALPAEEKTGGRHVLTITDRAAIETVFAAFGADLSRTVAHHINLAVLENDCCRASFLRGAFLAGGSVTDPSKNYHLELITAHASVSRETAALLTELGFAARSIDRGANTVLYFKKSEAIEDFLTKIGAPCAAMDIMSAKVEKSMNNSINRKVNCDTATATATLPTPTRSSPRRRISSTPSAASSATTGATCCRKSCRARRCCALPIPRPAWPTSPRSRIRR